MISVNMTITQYNDWIKQQNPKDVRPRRSPKPIRRYQDEKFVPGSNNGYTAGRPIDPVDFGFDPECRGHPGFQPKGVARLPTSRELEEDELLAGVDYETESEAESTDDEWEPTSRELEEDELVGVDYETESEAEFTDDESTDDEPTDDEPTDDEPTGPDRVKNGDQDDFDTSIESDVLQFR